MKIADRIARGIVAVVLLQTLCFKFFGSDESVYIFQQLGVDPWGRFAAGLVELLASVLILVPRTAWLGSLTALGVMSGAILSHLFVLGIVVMGDGGLLFSLALVVFSASLFVLRFRWPETPLATSLGIRIRRVPAHPE